MGRMTKVPLSDDNRTIPVAQLRAMIKLLSPGELTPTAKRQLTLLCDEGPDGAGDEDMSAVAVLYIQKWEADISAWEDWNGSSVRRGPYLDPQDAVANIELIRKVWPRHEQSIFRVVQRITKDVQLGEDLGPLANARPEVAQ